MRLDSKSLPEDLLESVEVRKERIAAVCSGQTLPVSALFTKASTAVMPRQ